MMGGLCRLRDFVVSRLVQTHVLPKSLLWMRHIPGVRTVHLLSVADVLLISPQVILVVLGYFNSIVRPSVAGSGNVALGSIITTVLLTNKKSSVFSVFFGLSWISLVTIHCVSALVTISLSLLHGWVAFSAVEKNSGLGAAYPGYASTEFSLWKYAWSDSTTITGSMALVCMAALILFSASRAFFRAFFFDFWLFTHVVLASGSVILVVLHEKGIMTAVAVWWAIDWILRYAIVGSFRQSKLTVARLTSAAEGVAEIRFAREFRFKAGQFLRVAIPAVGGLQFHPASITSAPYQNDITLHMVDRGGWTHGLCELAQEGCEVDIVLEGPYGSMALDLAMASHVLLIAGGIGITPLVSIVRQLLHEHQQSKTSVHLVWVVRDLAVVRALPILVPGIDLEQRETTNSDVSLAESMLENEVEIRLQTASAHIKIEIYVTGDKVVDRTGRLIDGAPYQVHYGSRPDIDSIVGSSSMGSMAVIACGPEGLVNETATFCRKHSSCGRNIVFHKEVFGY